MTPLLSIEPGVWPMSDVEGDRVDRLWRLLLNAVRMTDMKLAVDMLLVTEAGLQRDCLVYIWSCRVKRFGTSL